MKIYVGTVVSDVDETRQNILKVSIDQVTDERAEVPVIYTTPAASPLGGGFVAPVEEGARILVCSPDNSSYLYYMGTIMEGSPDGNPNTFSVGERLTSAGFITKEGQGVEMTTEISESEFHAITRLKGHGGAGQVIINNHPGNESVTMQAQGLNTSVKVNGASNTKPDQIEISAANSVTSRSRKGSNYMNVGPFGGELKIINEGTQANPMRPPPLGLFNGDVRIESENNNVVIKSCTDPVLVATDPAEGAGVTIQAGSVPNPTVEIRVDSQGFVNIKGALGIRMESGANIDLNAVGQVNIKGAQVNLQPTSTIAPMPPIPPAKR